MQSTPIDVQISRRRREIGVPENLAHVIDWAPSWALASGPTDCVRAFCSGEGLDSSFTTWRGRFCWPVSLARANELHREPPASASAGKKRRMNTESTLAQQRERLPRQHPDVGFRTVWVRGYGLVDTEKTQAEPASAISAMTRASSSSSGRDHAVATALSSRPVLPCGRQSADSASHSCPRGRHTRTSAPLPASSAARR
jgi:hypothetical protein